MKKFIINVDGGSRGNPGPAGVGVAFFDDKKQLLKTYSNFLGETTNNEAEYQALILALQKFKALFGKEIAKKAEIEIRSDSELLVRQMLAEYKVENENLQKLFMKLWNLRLDFGKIKFVLVPREENTKADCLANEAMDSNSRPKSLF